MAASDVPSIPADEHVLVALVPTIADTSAPSLATDLATVTDISCYLTPDGLSPALTENTVSDERLCSAQSFEQPGSFSYALDLIYIDNTNGEASAPNDAKDTLVPWTAQFLIIRRGIDYKQPLAEGDLIDIWPIKPGQYSKQPPERNSVLKIAQKQFVVGPVVQDVAVVA